MIRIAVTDLDLWVNYLANDPDVDHYEITRDTLLRRLARVDPPTGEMEAGRAFAKAMESLAEHPGGTVDRLCVTIGAERYTFGFPKPAEVYRPDLVEQRLERLFQTPHGPVLLLGRYDAALLGRSGMFLDTIIDYKLRLSDRPVEWEKFGQAMQWRAYLLMTGARRFVYQVFPAEKAGTNAWTIGQAESFEQYWYGGIEADVRRAVEGLAGFLTESASELLALRLATSLESEGGA